MAHQFYDDIESTSASTVSTFKYFPQQHQEQEERLHPEEEPYTYKKKTKRRSKPFLPPISAVRRISWDNLSFDKNLERENSNHKKKASRSQKSSRMRGRNSGDSLNNTLRGSGNSFTGSNRSNPQESLNGRHNEEDKKTSSAVTIGRELFVVFILIIAGVFGSMAFQ